MVARQRVLAMGASVVFSFGGGCLLLPGCVSDSEGDYVWSVTWRTGLSIERDLEHSPEKRTHDEFEFKPQVAEWLFNRQTVKDEVTDDVSEPDDSGG